MGWKMSTQVIQGERYGAAMGAQKFSMLETYALMRAHPRKLFIDAVSYIWVIYFLWNHNWQRALFAALVCGAIGLLSVVSAETQRLSETTLGKLALLHLHPANLTAHLIGVVGIGYGVWEHSTEFILAGLSVALFGHFFGWEKVDDRFSMMR